MSSNLPEEASNIPAKFLVIKNVEGVSIFVDPEVISLKSRLIASAQSISKIDGEVAAEKAGAVLKSISSLIRLVEKSRTEIKAPVNQLGKRIDFTASTFIVELKEEKQRLSDEVVDYKRQQEDLRRKEIARKAAEALAAEEAARKAAEAKEALEELTASFVPANTAELVEEVTERLAVGAAASETAMEAADKRAELREIEKRKASEGLANAKVSVNSRLDIEVTDILKLAQYDPSLVQMLPRKQLILQRVKEGETIPGVIQKWVDSVRA